SAAQRYRVVAFVATSAVRWVVYEISNRLERHSMSEHTTRVLAAERLAIVQWFGRVTFGEIVAWMDELVAHPGFSADFDGIVDLRKGDLTGMTPAEVQAVADLMIERRLTRGRWAHLADGPMETAFS